jgi:hypothetical protein
VIAAISASGMPKRIAWAIFRIRSGLGVSSSTPTASQSTAPPGVEAPAISTSFKPVRPISMERSAFCSDSPKERPIAIASPTDFMEVVSSGFAPGNFSKVKRGILVTT